MGLFLSDILGGPEQVDKPFTRIADAICQRKDAYQRDVVSGEDGTINVVFQYPGSLLHPDFAGIRTGSYSKKKRILEMQVAFPAEMISSDRFTVHYVMLLKDALLEGKRFFERKGIAFSLEDHLALVDKSVEGLIEMR